MTGGPAGFGVENLPYGVARLPGGEVRCVSALHDQVVDLAVLAATGALDGPGPADARVFEDPSLNRFLACGRPAREGVRRRLGELVAQEDDRLARAFVSREAVELLLPVAVGDFADFSASLHHATNMGRLRRPGADPLPPSWRRMPIGYHGRAGGLVVSGTPVVRPHGLVAVGGGDAALRPTAALDFEAEVGFVVAAGNTPGTPVPTATHRDHVAGVLLVNDWSARDIQAFESWPLGPFLAKSFATSVSPWLVTLDALEPYLVAGPRQDPPPAPYLATEGPSGLDVRLEVAVQSELMRACGLPPVAVSRPDFAGMYWTGPQLLAHLTVNGARIRPGDLFASGTVSGADPGTEGSLLELAWDGRRPLRLPDGSTRTYLEDGDTVVLGGWAGGDGRPLISLGDVTGTVRPARGLEE